MIQKTFVMLKPDTIQRNLVGDIISRFERRGLKFVAMKLIKVDRTTAEKLYSVHKDKEFYQPLIDYVVMGPCVVCVIEGYQAIHAVRKMLGATNPIDSDAGSIRGDFGLFLRRNVVHAADSEETAEREMKIFFKADEILDYKKAEEEWVYER